jgi:ferredoxin
MGFILPHKNFEDFLRFLKSEFTLVAPVNRDGLIIFDKINSLEEIVKNYINTAFPPKKFFIPNEEVIYAYEKLGKDVKLIENKEFEKILIFGIRPCDANALNLLDLVFKDDPYYLSRRENTKTIVLKCDHAGPNCFCTSFRMNRVKKGFDLSFTTIHFGYYVEVGSKFGKKLVKTKFFKRTSKKFKKEFIDYKRSFLIRELEEKLEKIFEDKIWEEKFKDCLACGACTIVCPTCYCFSLVHQPNFGKGKVKRILDSCTLTDFSRVAGDFVFRKEKFKRMRQFIYHKFYYFKKRYGSYLCVGCGRCIEHCPSKIDFQKVLSEIK